MRLHCSAIFTLLLARGLLAAPDVQFLDDSDEFPNLPLAYVEDDGDSDPLERSLRARLPSIFSDVFSNRDSPFPIVSLDYGGLHPFERRRKLQSTSNVYRPLAMTFITEPLEAKLGADSVVDDEINNVLNTILPRVQSIWSSHLSVVPNTKPIPIASTDCFGLAADQLPSTVLENGVANTDLVIITSAIDTITDTDGTVVDFCKTGVLASAFSCATDQFDRPILGFINFCLGNSTSSQRRMEETSSRTGQRKARHTTSDRRRTATLASEDDNVAVVLHEIGHVLGMSDQHFPYFRDATTGEPLTPRPIALQDATCTNGEIQSVRMASSKVLQKGVTDRGLIYYDIVTPRVQQVVRNHFNCPSLNGARLENHDTNPNDCTGSHWSERLFFGELMQPVVLPGSLTALSPLTLALLEDSGWYRVNYTDASPIAFGQGAGCIFVNGDCIVNDAVPDEARDYFCSSVAQLGSDGHIDYNETDIFCDPLHYELAVCNLFDEQEAQALVNSAAPDGVDVRYFSNQNLVGLSPQGDFCPIPNIPLNLDCTDSTLGAFVTYEGEQFGETSRCINVQFDSISGKKRNLAGCFETKCDATTRKVVVNGVTCDYDFQELTIRAASSNIPVTMICPRLSTICPELTACPNDCSGRGTCNSGTVPPTCQSPTSTSDAVGRLRSSSSWISAAMGTVLLFVGACFL